MDQKPEYTWLRGVRQAWLDGELVEPPDWARRRAQKLFRMRPPAASLIGRVRAALVFDSRASGLARVGVRSGAVQDGPWQLLYRGGDMDVDLLVRPNQDGRTLTLRGQALPVQGAPVGSGMVEATPADGDEHVARPSARSKLEPTGEFALPDLERGRYDVLLRIGAREIELTDLEL